MILIASHADYSNLGNSVARALNAVGVDCIDVCLQNHAFKYGENSLKVTRLEMRRLASMCDMTIVMHSHPDILSFCQPGKYAVYHTGTRFRNDPARHNKIFRNAYRTLTDQTEFMEMGQMHYVVSAIDDNGFKFHDRKTPKIGHYPSKAEVKGSRTIEVALKGYKVDFDYRKLKHSDNLKRMQSCDIYVELFKPRLNGLKYGCFGVTALEAGMMGKVVITQDLNRHVYEENYGEHPFLLARTSTDLPKLVDYATNNLKELREQTREIVFKNHSLEATGERLKQILNL